MSRLLVLSGSSRPNSAGANVLELIKKDIESRGHEAEIVDVKTLDLPFFDGSVSPSTEGFAAEYPQAVSWTKQVEAADAVVLLTPEYNGSLSAIQKNAIDWVYGPWHEKPVALIGYGWGGAKRAHDNARVVLSNVKASVLPQTSNFNFMQELALDGTILDEANVSAQIKATIDEVVSTIK